MSVYLFSTYTSCFAKKYQGNVMRNA
ncbi:MAG: hypothetical protein ACD_48C00434G0001, partial [uncultured bacterium]